MNSTTFESEVTPAHWEVKWAEADDPYLDHLLADSYEPFAVVKQMIYLRKYVGQTAEVES